jgi:hypothetical protein
LTRALRITVTRRESYDPLSVIEQATRQAVAQQIAREHADPHDREALTFRYQKDANSEGDYVDLVISGTDETRVGLVLRRLRAHGYDDLTVEWLADEDPPHLVTVFSSEAGLPAPPSRAREVLEAFGLHVPLVPDTEDGVYKTLVPEFFPDARSVALGDSEWTVSVLRRS